MGLSAVYVAQYLLIQFENGAGFEVAENAIS